MMPTYGTSSTPPVSASLLPSRLTPSMRPTKPTSATTVVWLRLRSAHGTNPRIRLAEDRTSSYSQSKRATRPQTSMIWRSTPHAPSRCARRRTHSGPGSFHVRPGRCLQALILLPRRGRHLPHASAIARNRE